MRIEVGKDVQEGICVVNFGSIQHVKAHSALVQLSLKLDVEDASTFFKGVFEDKKDVKRVQFGHLIEIVLPSQM